MSNVAYHVEKNIPVIAETDVLVVGAGPGGASAAVMAARRGAKTIIAERYGCPGGMAVFGEVTPFMYNLVNDQSLDKPVYVDWCRRLHHYKTETELAAEPFTESVPYRPISKAEATLALEELLLEAGVQMLYHHTLFDVVKEGDKIVTAIFHSKSGLVAVRAKVFIDSTGDGDLAVMAGAPFEFGNEDGFCQPMTTCFKLEHIDRSIMPQWGEINEIYDKVKAEGGINCPRENVLWFPMPADDVIHFNTTRIIKKSAVSGTDLSDAEVEGRRQVREFLSFLRTHVPGFKNSHLRSIAHHVGVRESRRILGVVYQTQEDFLNRSKFADGIAKINYSIDIHNPGGSGTKIIAMEPGNWYELRYGTLIPRNTGNLLMGCRAISVDHALHSSSRVMPPVCSIGQAAGMAAAMCVEKNCEPVELAGEDVRKNLAAAGAWL